MPAKKRTKSVDEIIAENEKLTSRVANLESNISEMAAMPATKDKTLLKFMEEINNIKRTARVDSNKINIVETVDHKNISLWTKLGKRIGPLHQTNALATFHLFYNLGIMLSTQQPTTETIEAYKKTKEFKIADEAFKKSREIKERSRGKGKIEKYLKEIAKMTGQNVEAIHGILKGSQVKSLSEAHEVG